MWLFEVGVGVGVELWRRLWCLLCFTVGRVLCAGCFFWCCRVARTCPACDHDSLISMYFVLF